MLLPAGQGSAVSHSVPRSHLGHDRQRKKCFLHLRLNAQEVRTVKITAAFLFVFMGVSPGFTGFDAGSVTGFTIPARYSVNDVCTDSTGKTAAACTCSPAGGRSTGVIFTMNGSFDSLVVQHRRIHGLNSIFCLPEGYLVTGPADPNFRDTAVSMIGEDGSVSWVLIMDNPGNTGGTPWRVCCGTSGGDAVLSAGSSIALVDRTGSLLWTNSFGN